MEYRAGLWKKKSQKGYTYCSGKIKIGTTEFQIRLFNNDKKGNDKAPDFNLIIKDDVEIKTEEHKENKKQVDPFEAFGEKIETEDIPF